MLENTPPLVFIDFKLQKVQKLGGCIQTTFLVWACLLVLQNEQIWFFEAVFYCTSDSEAYFKKPEKHIINNNYHQQDNKMTRTTIKWFS